MSKLKFSIEQIALAPKDPAKARQLLNEMGFHAEEWIKDTVHASGVVFGSNAENRAELNFFEGMSVHELEILDYQSGTNWIDETTGGARNIVSHLGMHCSDEDELNSWKVFFAERGISIAQEVETLHHTNPAIAGKRQYHYVVFNTREILGTDIKIILRCLHGSIDSYDPVEDPYRCEDFANIYYRENKPY